MIFSKTGKMTLLVGLLCLLLMGFAGSSYGQTGIQWNVFPAPTEVIYTGRAEVLGSISLFVRSESEGVVTGGLSGQAYSQIGIMYNQKVQIDNSAANTANVAPATIDTGIRVYSNKFSSGSQIQVLVQNLDLLPFDSTTCRGFITLTIPPGVVLNAGDYIRVDGVRGRIDMSLGNVPGVDLFAQLQSINDPAGNQFFPETVRVATSFVGMIVTNVNSANAALCLLDYGKGKGEDHHDDVPVPPGNIYDTYQQPSFFPTNTAGNPYSIKITEGFVRAFVAKDSNGAGHDPSDRLDTGGMFLGQPDPFTSTPRKPTGTLVQVVINNIPASVMTVDWPTTVYQNASPIATFSSFHRTTDAPVFTAATGTSFGFASAIYEYFTANQTFSSDSTLESFVFSPMLRLSQANQADTHQPLIAASLYGASDVLSGLCASPNYMTGSNNTVALFQPRFHLSYLSWNNGTLVGGPAGEITDPKSSLFGVYAVFAPCQCYLLFPYITSDLGIVQPAGSLNWDTGISVANTTDDVAVFGTVNGAPKQQGGIKYFFYDKNFGYALAPASTPGDVLPGRSYVTLASQLLSQIGTVPGYTAPASPVFPYVTNGGFHGYMIAQANFQYCHGYAFISDVNFNTISQGYLANVIPDPSVKSRRSPSAAADTRNPLPAGESLNN